MGCFGKCACPCCLEPEDMPYESVSLIAPLDDCEGGLGGGGIGIGGPGGPGEPIYPSAEFIPAGCCFTADFNLGCQEYVKNCAVLSTLETNISAKFEYYRRKIPYLATGNETIECPCILIQSNLVSEDTIHKRWWLERHKLVGLRIHVGKTLVKCGDSEPACKFYVAVSYIYEYCEFVLGWSTASLFAEFTGTYTCTGVYRDGTCSFSNQFQNSSTINDCNDMLASFPSQFCSESQQKIISRIKLFDALPSGQISIGDADLPPVSCCGGQTNCTVSSSPCGLYLIDNCMPNLPQSDEPFYAFCSGVYGLPPHAEGCEINIGCPSIREIPPPSPPAPLCVNFYVYSEAADCYILTAGPSGGGNVINSTQIHCGYCDEGGQTIWLDQPIMLLDLCSPGATLCVTGECCQDSLNSGVQYVCQEFYEGLCATVISDLECSIGEAQHFSGGAFCFNLPTVTIELP